MITKSMRNALAAMPLAGAEHAPVVVDLVRRYAKATTMAARLEREAKKADRSVERVNLLREARGQMQTALKCLREASEHAHRAARVGARVGQGMPDWLGAVEGDDAPAVRHS